MIVKASANVCLLELPRRGLVDGRVRGPLGLVSGQLRTVRRVDEG